MISDILSGMWASRINVPPDLIQSLRGTETHTRNDYLGRAVFEFFQNAVDRAERRIEIILREGEHGGDYHLIVANDGNPVSVLGLEQPQSFEFPLPGGGEGRVLSRYGADLRSDFQALCNIHNSNKQAGQSIGNKGVGFKSAWEFASRITVASTLPNGERYAFRFHHDLRPELVRDTDRFWPELSDTLREAAAAVLDRTTGLPSFYFPEFISTAGAYFSGLEWAHTVIVLEGINKAGHDRLLERIEEFRQSELFFINQLRDKDGQKRQRNVDVVTHAIGKSHAQTTRLPDDWRVVDETLLADLWPNQVVALRKDAETLNFGIKSPSLAIAFPPEQKMAIDGEAKRKERFFCYLPTYADCGFGVLVHADFMLDMSRKHIEVAQNSYNRRLLNLAGRLLGRALLTLPELHGRADVMRFLLPGQANNPPLDELRRGLASELYLPVTDSAADPTTLRSFLAAIFPPGRSPWPEIRYCQTLEFLRVWGRYLRYEHQDPYKKRVAPFLGVFRDLQVPVLPEKIENGQVKVVLPLPEVDKTGRLRDGSGIFWRRKLVREENNPASLQLSLGEAGIVGLAVTEWEQIRDADKTLLGLLDFNLNEIAHRLRIYVENACAAQAVVHTENLSFSPAAVLGFIAALLLRSEKTTLDSIQPLGFLAATGTSADNLSKMLLPVLEGGWRIGREIMLPNVAPSLQGLLTGSQGGLSTLDLASFQRACGLSDDPHSARQLALAFGVWPCFPLRQTGESWGLPFNLSLLQTPENRDAFYQAFTDAWSYWLVAAPAVAGQVACLLQHSTVPWIPLDADYNTPENRYGCPMGVLLVNERDRARQPFLLKKIARSETESGALKAVGVVAASEADIDKLLTLLAYMGQSSPTDEAMRGRYRNLVLELARRDWTQYAATTRDRIKALPVLVSQVNSRAWISAEQARTAWFAPRAFQNARTLFRDECSFVDLDADTPVPWLKSVLGVRWFEPKLTLGSGEPNQPKDTLPLLCHETRQRIQECYLADLLLIAESASIGGMPRNREAIVAEWRRLIIRRCERVWLRVELDGMERFIGADPGRYDVLLDNTSNRLEIWHDMPMTDIETHWHLFAEPLASGVFGNRLLTDAFAAYLGSGERRVTWLADRYGITDDDRSSMRSNLAREFLSDDELHGLVQALRLLPAWNGQNIDPESLLARWWDPGFYLENQLALDANALRDNLPAEFSERLPYLDPSMINKRRWEQSFDSKELRKAVLTALLDEGESDIKTMTTRRLEFLLAEPNGLSRFDFNPEMEQRRRLEAFCLECSCYRDWCNLQRKSLNWLSAEGICSGELDDYAILTAPFDSSSTTAIHIAPTEQTATRRVFRTTQSAREQDSRNNHRAGMSAEHCAVLASARNLQESSDRAGRWGEVLQLWQIVQGEFDNLPDLPAHCPQGSHELVHALHVASSIGDGLGFDVIEVGPQPGQVWLAEVKSATGGRLFLSENERLKALRYEKLIGGRWRLKVWLGGGKWADDTVTLAVLKSFQDIEARLLGNHCVRPEGWVFQLGNHGLSALAKS